MQKASLLYPFTPFKDAGASRLKPAQYQWVRV